MLIDEIDQTDSKIKLNKLIQVLEQRFDTRLDFSQAESVSDLKDIFAEMERIKTRVIESVSFNTYHQSRDYTRACLIQEAIQIFLSEVAPGRQSGKTTRIRKTK